MSQQFDLYFVAWRSKNAQGEAIFGSLIYRAPQGDAPTQVMVDVMPVISVEHKIDHQNIRITAFNRV